MLKRNTSLWIISYHNNNIITHTCQDRSPYVYEIHHKPSGKLYIGLRFAKNCHHTELLEPNGYQTSSKSVKELIRQDGLGSFEITYIEEFDNKDYAHKNELYINKSIGYYIVQDNEISNKRKNTNFKKYGYDYALQSDIIRNKNAMFIFLTIC